MHKAYLALGSNLGDRQEYLDRAVESLAAFGKVTKQSEALETAPWGNTDQDYFLNMCLEFETELEPKELLESVKKLEKDLGRIERPKWGPREIDIDIIYYDELVMEEDALAIPHPFMHERAFVLEPLAQIAPDLKHPRLGKTPLELLELVD